MHLSVSYAHGALVVAPRARQPRLRPFLDRVAVEIVETTAADAPVGLRVRERKEPTRELRLHGGRLFEPVSRNGWPTDAAGLAREADRAWRDAYYGSPLSAGPPRWGDGEESYYPVDAATGLADDPAVARVLRSDAEARAEAVRAAARDLLLVDGRLHAACPEPVYVRSDRWVRTVPLGGPGARDAGAEHLFRADERDLLDPPPGSPEIEVLLPGAVRAPLPQLAAAEAAAFLVEQMSEHKALRDGSIDLLVAYARLRDAVADLRGRIPVEGDRATLGSLPDLWVEAIARHVEGARADRAYMRDELDAAREAALDRLAAFHGQDLDLPAPGL